MLRLGLVIILLTLIFSKTVSAESSYVLPYPSAMPGSIFYKLNLIQEELLRYWYFGNFGNYQYSLKQSDKYLVGAKTLFEYKQFFLGFGALIKSNEHFENIYPSLSRAKSHGKNISQKLELLKNARDKHIEVLSKLRDEVPEFVKWAPEKEKPSDLDLWNLISYSIKIRKRPPL